MKLARPGCSSDRKERGRLLPQLLVLDGTRFESGGQALRTALSLSALTGIGFEARQLGDLRRPGLGADHLAAVRALAMACRARLGGAFVGSIELRFVPGQASPGVFDFDLTADAAPTLVLETVAPVLAQAQGDSRLSVMGGTHVPGRPTFHFLERQWAVLAAATGLRVRLTLVKAAFQSKGAGQIQADVPARREGLPLAAEKRGGLVAIRALGGASRTRGDALKRLRDAAQGCFWERRRLEPVWDVLELPATSPGYFSQVDLVFEQSRASFDALGSRSVRPEVAGERLALACLRFLEGEAAVDRFVADQMVVPMIASGQGGRVSTEAVTDGLLAAVETAQLFGFKARVWGARGAAGGVEVDRS